LATVTTAFIFVQLCHTTKCFFYIFKCQGQCMLPGRDDRVYYVTIYWLHNALHFSR